MSTLLLADHDGAKLLPETATALTAALQLGEPVDILVAGQDVSAIAQAASMLAGAARVLVADHALYAHRLVEPLAELILSLSQSYSALVSAATSTGKNTLPRVAALRDVMQISEVIAVLGPSTFMRPIYAGNAIQTVETSDSFRVLTVRATAFEAAPSTGSAPLEAVAYVDTNSLTNFVSADIAQSDRPELSGAKIVVSGGRGLGSKEQFEHLLTPLADSLGAALGASRAAVDAGYAPNDWQVGQTGKVVAPELYIAVGISGAIQHIAGMKDAKTIVAINKDADAPIFQIADYGLVGDLFDIIPQLTSAVRK